MQNWIDSEFFGCWKDAQIRITKCLTSLGRSIDRDYADSARNWQKPGVKLACRWGESVVRQALELQAKWIDLWVHQSQKESVDLRGFSEHVQLINRSMQVWGGIQDELWKVWFSLLDRSLGNIDPQDPNRQKLETWKKLIQESETDLNHWFTKWEEQVNCKPLVPDSLNRLVEKLGMEMLGWIQNQAIIWQYGFDLVRPAARRDSESQSDFAKDHKAPAERDNLTELPGIGPIVEQMLNSQNIMSFRQIANLSDEEIRYLENHVIRFPGQLRRNAWIEEAKELCDRD